MNFAFIAWLDTFELAASLRTRAGLFKTEEPGRRILPVRSIRKGTEEVDEDFVGFTYATPAKWPELGNLRSRLTRLGNDMLGAVEFGRIFFEQLDPGATLAPHRETGPYFERWRRAHLPIRTNPGAMLYSGIEQVSPAPGNLVGIAMNLPCWAVNLGEYPRVHLIVDFRKKETEE